MSKTLVVYRGPSAYDPSVTIRAVLTTESANVKTGDMAQLWIMHDTTPPHVAVKTGEDNAICGACPFRPSKGGGCYVVTFQGPLSTWRATQGQEVAGAGSIRDAIRGKPVRLGAYGDPAALPIHVVQFLARATGGRFTGYTHGWHTRPDLAPFVMASVHSIAEGIDAMALGFRTFRTRAPGADLAPSEIECPSEKVECKDCLLCRGASLKARSISIPVHGVAVKRALSVVQ